MPRRRPRCRPRLPPCRQPRTNRSDPWNRNHPHLLPANPHPHRRIPAAIASKDFLVLAVAPSASDLKKIWKRYCDKPPIRLQLTAIDYSTVEGNNLLCWAAHGWPPGGPHRRTNPGTRCPRPRRVRSRMPHRPRLPRGVGASALDVSTDLSAKNAAYHKTEGCRGPRHRGAPGTAPGASDMPLTPGQSPRRDILSPTRTSWVSPWVSKSLKILKKY